MASKRELALRALHARLQSVPLAKIERNRLRPERIPAEGLIILRDGDIGEPTILLSPVSYVWTHVARAEVFAASADPDEQLDQLLIAIGAALADDPSLGGTVDQIEIGAPDFDGAAPEGGPDIKAAIVPIRLIYETQAPLG